MRSEKFFAAWKLTTHGPVAYLRDSPNDLWTRVARQCTEDTAVKRRLLYGDETLEFFEPVFTMTLISEPTPAGSALWSIRKRCPSGLTS